MFKNFSAKAESSHKVFSAYNVRAYFCDHVPISSLQQELPRKLEKTEHNKKTLCVNLGHESLQLV